MGTLEATSDRSAFASLAERVKAIDRVPWIESLKVVLVTRIVFFVLAYAGSWLFATGTTGPPTESFIEMWTRWDAVHFEHIADFGYLGPRSDTHATAFFPLFPMLEGTGAVIGLSAPAMGMIISAIACVVAGAYLYRLGEEDLGEG